MQQECDEKFKKQFGSLTDDGNLIPPTSSCYNKASIILNSMSNIAHSIPIEMFHPVEGEEQQAQITTSRRINSQRIPQLVVTITESQSYKSRYQTTSNEIDKGQIIKEFWKNVVHPRALELWERQKVMNERDGYGGTIGDGDKLNLSFLTKKNRNDKWGSDNLGKANEKG